ncbi:hypothetical protein MKEN_00426800 [Mycena kentingensis (nom. inval.)]|nr:hypothetical protein MKEN_00426800 [Mycena kentingensis (nom. inval.)]
MLRLGSLLSLAYLFTQAAPAPAPAAAPGWQFVEKGHSGIVALEAAVVSPTLVLFYDRATNDPLKTDDGKVAWGALWNLETNEATALKVLSDAFCASGSILSNGTMVSVGGNIPASRNVNDTGAVDGRMGIRLFDPCTDANGEGCTVFEDLDNIHLAETRWYPSSLRIFDGSLMVVGDPVNSYEFWPSKDGGVPRESEFLTRSNPVNLFPRAFALPDGKIFIISNNQSIIYDIETNTETALPDLPNGQRITNPFDGTATLLPLSPPDYIPEVLACGGSHTSDTADPETLSAQDPASAQCSRMTLTPEGIEKGWEVEEMPEARMMPEMILLPDGKILIINGGTSGYAAIRSVGTTFGASNAANAVFTPVLYDPSLPLGSRMSNDGLPASPIARMYHSSVTLTPQGNILLAGSNANGNVTILPEGAPGFSSEFRVETLDPPYMALERPVLSNAPSKIAFNQEFTINIDIPASLETSSIKVALIDLGFSTHAFHSSSRLVFLDATLSSGTLTVTSPPNNRVYPPGIAYIYVTVGDRTSAGVQVMVGTGG